jgi:hypothetical protein
MTVVEVGAEAGVGAGTGAAPLSLLSLPLTNSVWITAPIAEWQTHEGWPGYAFAVIEQMDTTNIRSMSSLATAMHNL